MSTPQAVEDEPASESAPTASTRSLNRQVVLEEDEYTAALSHIIARDFFPSLQHLDATNNYLDALRTEDPHLINATVRQLQELGTPSSKRYRPLQTPSQTPWAGAPSDTPLRTPLTVDGEPLPKKPRYDVNMSLDTFQARYTSEDNSSFTQILDDENRKRRERWGWAWEAQKKVEAQRDKMLKAREKLLIEPAASSTVGVRGRAVIEAPTERGLITANGEQEKDEPQNEETQENGTNEEASGRDDDGEEERENANVALVLAGGDRDKSEQLIMNSALVKKKDSRPAGVDGWNFKARNALMFPPDADVTPYQSNMNGMSASDPKTIKYDNTRLPEQEEKISSGLSEPPSPTRSRVEAAITGTPYRPRSPTTNGFSLLPNMPSPTPSELGPAAVKQLMTWGTLNATPRILNRAEDSTEVIEPENMTFHLKAPSNREVISQRLSADAAKNLRAKAALMGGSGSKLGLAHKLQLGTPRSVRGASSNTQSMPPPTWTPRKADAAGSLTPAARRLLDRTTVSVASARRADAMGKATQWESTSAKAKEKDLNKVRWTPSPAPVARKR